MKYIEPQIEILKFNSCDVIITSGLGTEDDVVTDPNVPTIKPSGSF